MLCVLIKQLLMSLFILLSLIYMNSSHVIAELRMRKLLWGWSVLPGYLYTIYMAAGEGQDKLVADFATYSDFLDSQITPTDLYYLEVREYVAFMIAFSTTR